MLGTIVDIKQDCQENKSVVACNTRLHTLSIIPVCDSLWELIRLLCCELCAYYSIGFFTDSNGGHPKTSKYLHHNSNSNSRPLPNPGPKKHSGIRSLLGADNSSNDSSSVSKPHSASSSSELFPGTGLTMMDVVKNNIETAIRHDVDYESSRGSLSNSGLLSSKMPAMGGFSVHPSQMSPHMGLAGSLHSGSRESLSHQKLTGVNKIWLMYCRSMESFPHSLFRGQAFRHISCFV